MLSVVKGNWLANHVFQSLLRCRSIDVEGGAGCCTQYTLYITSNTALDFIEISGMQPVWSIWIFFNTNRADCCCCGFVLFLLEIQNPLSLFTINNNIRQR